MPARNSDLTSQIESQRLALEELCQELLDNDEARYFFEDRVRELAARFELDVKHPFKQGLR